MMGDCGDVVASLWPTMILPRVVEQATRTTLDLIGTAIGVDMVGMYDQLDEVLDPAVYTATAKGTA